MSQTAHDLGRDAESIACDHLEQKGFEVVAKNWRSNRGELDIICRDGDALVFVEVKARSNNRFGGAPWALPPSKRDLVIRTARHYLAERRLYGRVACRFDVVLVDAGVIPYGVTHITDAFQAESL
ncbi:MAG: YraN family protein [Leptospirillia bacterium]